MKPDFDKIARVTLADTPAMWKTPCNIPDAAFHGIAGSFAVALREAYAAGLERAAHIAEKAHHLSSSCDRSEWAVCGECVAKYIRAEKDAQQ